MKKRLISAFVVLAIMFSYVLTVPITSFAAKEVSINFDDLTAFVEKADYIPGGAYNTKGVSITSEKDHTTGNGKSLKMEGRTSVTHRMKFVDSVNMAMYGKKTTASVWVLTLIDTKVQIGAYSTINTKYATEPYAKQVYDVKANTWTKLTLEFVHNDPLITQITISQDNCAGSPLAETIYIDDLFVTADGIDTGDTLVDYSRSFDDMAEFTNKVDFILGGSGVPPENVTLTTEKDHTTGNGKSVKMTGRTSGTQRLKFVDSVKPEMIGSTVTASVWVLTDIDTKFAIGTYSAPNTKYATAPLAKEIYDVKANEWTKLTLVFDHFEPLITQITVSQDNCNNAPVASTFYADDLFVTTGSESSNENTQDLKTENIIDFNNISSLSELNIEGGGGSSLKNVTLCDTEFYGESGKSLLFRSRINPYDRIKFMGVFDNLPKAKGTQYNISMMIKIPENSKIKTGQFFFTVIDFLGAAGNGKEYYRNPNYKYIVNAGEWTKVELKYISTGEKAYGIAIEHDGVSGIPSIETTIPNFYIDDVIVKVSDELIAQQPVRTDDELKKALDLGIDVIVNDTRLSFATDTKPTIVEDRTLVPLRKIFENLNCAVYWDNDTNTVTGKRGNNEVKLTIGEKTAYVNGKAVELDVPALLINDRTLVPARFIAESLGCKVDWNDEKQQVIITDNLAENEINIYTDLVKQEIYGFGCAANHNAYHVMNAKPEMQQKVMNLLYNDETGIGLNMVRLEVNPFSRTDESPFNPEYQFTIEPEKGVWEMDADKHQIWYSNELLKINPDLMFLASVWSPPSWMKYNKKVVGPDTEAGMNTLDPAFTEDFAEYLAKWAKYYKDDLGYDLRWLSIQNEPDLQTTYASCAYSPNTLLNAAKAISKKFKEEGISTLVGGPECSNPQKTDSYLNIWAQDDPDYVYNELGAVITHTYGYTGWPAKYSNLERFNLPLLATETCPFSSGNRGKTILDNGLIVKYGNEIAECLNHNYNAWFYWDSSHGVKELGKQGSESLVDFNTTTDEIMIAREYYAIGQFSKFIKPGYRIVASYSYNPDVAVVTAINPETGKLVTVVINNSKNNTSMKINGFTGSSASVYRSGEGEDLAKLDDASINNGVLTAEFKAQTVTTIVEK